MLLKRVPTAIARGVVAFFRPLTWFQRIFIGWSFLTVGFVTIGIAVGGIQHHFAEYKFTHLTAQQHLRLARAACGISSGQDARGCRNTSEAVRHLAAIPTFAEEYSTASDLLVSVRLKIANDDAARQKMLALDDERAYQQYQSNFSGEAHDAFTCATSTVNTPIVSFDGGGHWWKDDGRCDAQLERTRERRQMIKDSDAQLDSYWPTTLRVNTDMDSFWLPGEERTCQTYPDHNGRVATVACTSSGTHQDHNIPVKFWGGVDRNSASDWKCRREGDEFVCRAIN